jgi:peptidoglycan hydrolase-like protein with peptidoglycan-binding domain
MRKLKATTVIGTMLLAGIVPSFIYGAPRAKGKKAEHLGKPASKPTTSGSTARSTAHGKTPAAAASSATPSKTRRKSRARRSRRDTSWRRGQKGPTPDRINEIQEALARQGAYTGAPTGKWDAKTVEGLRRFQSAHNLNPTGKLDALTLQKLGLGSDIAGIAPPQPLLPDGPLAPRRQR